MPPFATPSVPATCVARFSVPEIVESVVDAAHPIAPLICASICPFVPTPKKVEVATAVGLAGT